MLKAVVYNINRGMGIQVELCSLTSRSDRVTLGPKERDWSQGGAFTEIRPEGSDINLQF